LGKWDQIEVAFLARSGRSSTKSVDNVRSVFAIMKSEISAPSLRGFDWEGVDPFIYGYESEIPIQRLEPFWRVLHSMRSVDSDALAAIMGNASSNASRKLDLKPDVDGDDEDVI
jgi:hypothetical protein